MSSKITFGFKETHVLRQERQKVCTIHIHSVVGDTGSTDVTTTVGETSYKVTITFTALLLQ